MVEPIDDRLKSLRSHLQHQFDQIACLIADHRVDKTKAMCLQVMERLQFSSFFDLLFGDLCIGIDSHITRCAHRVKSLVSVSQFLQCIDRCVHKGLSLFGAPTGAYDLGGPPGVNRRDCPRTSFYDLCLSSLQDYTSHCIQNHHCNRGIHLSLDLPIRFEPPANRCYYSLSFSRHDMFLDDRLNQLVNRWLLKRRMTGSKDPPDCAHSFGRQGDIRYIVACHQPIFRARYSVAAEPIGMNHSSSASAR